MRFRRKSGGNSRTLLLGLLGGLLAFAVLNNEVRAQGDIFTVRGVAVDVTAETAAAARQAAIADGHQRAFQRLMKRLVPEVQQAKVPVLEPGLVEFYVLDFSVNNERTSAVRYLADLTFRFNAEEVRGLLRSNAVEFAEARSKPLLVLALFAGEDQEPDLWLEPNPWRDVWAQRSLDGGLVPLRVPLGDLSDIAMIDTSRALAGDAASLTAIADSYGAGSVLVSQATVSGDPLVGLGQISLVSTRYENGRALLTTRESLVQLPEEGEADFLARAAGLVDGAIQEAWKGENTLQFSNQRSIVVYVPLGGLDDLMEVRQRIGRVASIQKSNVTSLSRNQAELVLSFVGNEQRLTRALAQRDLFLSLREDSNWELTLPGRAGPGGETNPRGLLPVEPQ